jgi:hypothetical protein
VRVHAADGEGGEVIPVERARRERLERGGVGGVGDAGPRRSRADGVASEPRVAQQLVGTAEQRVHPRAVEAYEVALGGAHARGGEPRAVDLDAFAEVDVGDAPRVTVAGHDERAVESAGARTEGLDAFEA